MAMSVLLLSVVKFDETNLVLYIDAYSTKILNVLHAKKCENSNSQ